MGDSENNEGLCREEECAPPTLGELMLEIPQDEEEFERLPLRERPLDFDAFARH